MDSGNYEERLRKMRERIEMKERERGKKIFSDKGRFEKKGRKKGVEVVQIDPKVKEEVRSVVT